jgi:hypothetical protein
VLSALRRGFTLRAALPAAQASLRRFESCRVTHNLRGRAVVQVTTNTQRRKLRNQRKINTTTLSLLILLANPQALTKFLWSVFSSQALQLAICGIETIDGQRLARCEGEGGLRGERC